MRSLCESYYSHSGISTPQPLREHSPGKFHYHYTYKSFDLACDFVMAAPLLSMVNRSMVNRSAPDLFPAWFLTDRCRHSQRAYKNASWPVSRVLCRRRGWPLPPRWPFIWDARRRTPQATNPDGDAETHSAPRTSRGAVPSLFGFAPGGVCPASPVARAAVRSYRTLSPLLYFRSAAPGAP
jgi:hypothetical protein